MRIFKPVCLLLIIFASFTGAHGQDAVQDCPDGLVTQLRTDGWGFVDSDVPNNRREAPTTTARIAGQIPAGDIFRVVDGPRCADGYIWWEVDYAGSAGWTAEGSSENGASWLRMLDGQGEISSVDETEGCLRPPEDYRRIQLGFATVNARTLAMLDQAQALYSAEGGIINLRAAIMQGGYNPGGVAASFGTHDGGGSLDLSVRSREDRRILTSEIEPMLRALRVAGFAAWLRDTDSLYPGSPIHIHAIAVGDAELSEAAREQIDGDFGYLRGYDGLPREDGIPQPDTSGEMVVCGWMTDMGFDDLRDTPSSA